MANKNVQIKKKNGSSWDNIFPISLATNIMAEGGSVEEVIGDKKKNTVILSAFMKKMRDGGSGSIACMGDSTTYGADNTNSRLPDSTPADDGTAHYANRADITYPESLQNHLSQIYGTGNITVTNKGFAGDGTQRGLQHWNASGADVCLIMYGINDADNSNIPYNGNVEEFLKYYRQIIEREIRNNTACIILSPIKLRIITANQSVSRHSKIDAFGQAARMLAEEYNLPFIDTAELLRGYGSEIYSDYTHLNTIGYNILGAKLSSIFIGQGAYAPFIISDEEILGVSLLNDNFKANNVQGWYFQSGGPTPTEDDSSGSTYINLKNEGATITYAFYTEKDNMVVIPHWQYGYDGFSFEFELDFGVIPSQFMNKDMIDNAYPGSPVSKATYDNSDKNHGLRFSPNRILFTNEKHLLIPTRGWHTVRFKVNQINPVGGVINWYGCKFENLDKFVSRTIQKSDLNLENSHAAYDPTGRPVQALKKNGIVFLEGVVSGLQQGLGKTILTLPSGYRPKNTRSYICSQFSGANIAYANVVVGSNGTITVHTASSTSDYLQLYQISFPVMD